MSITKVFNPRLNQYTYYTEKNGQLITLTYEDGIKQGLVMLEQIRAEIKHFMYEINPNSSESDYACNYVLEIIDKVLNEQNN